MTRLEYQLTHDALFKMLFVKYPKLLKGLVADLLELDLESIGEFVIRNPEMPPEQAGDKFCRLDITMTLDGRRINLEVQVRDEGDYPARALFHWAREYSTALAEGGEYRELPRAIIISILDFNLFECVEFHSEYGALEVRRHTPLSENFCLHFFELPKLKGPLSAARGLELWLTLFKAKTEEDLARLEALEVPIMKQAIEAYRSVAVSPEFQELERMRSKTRHDEAQALGNAERKGLRKGLQKGLRKGRLEGRQEGRQEGRLEGRLGVARKLMAMGLPINEIMDAADLTPEEFEKLKS